MAEAAASFLFDNLSRLLDNEAQLLWGFRPEVKYIRNELGHIRAFLRVADFKEESDTQLEEWVRQVREIAYDIEDVLDIYMLRFANRGETAGVAVRIRKIYASLMNLKSRHQIASKMQMIKSRVEHASQGYQRYKDIYPPIVDQSSSSIYDGRGDALLLEDADLVGIENPKKQLSQWIFSATCGLTIISVVGMGGLGKTTLVKKVYDDVSREEKFDHHLWITISESYNIENLLKSMIKLLVAEIKQPVPQDFDCMNADRMREFIYKFLQHKKYIIIFDDIWKIDAWEAIKYAFPRSTTGGCGCIIITSRLITIGNAMSGETNGHVYSLAPLPLEEAKQLFYRKAFPRKSCPLYLEKISESILRRCEGLPLAIVVIGALLATKNDSSEEWEMLNHRFSDGLESMQRMKKIISLSFYDLPYYLKSCFLYLSIFPEDEILERWRLIRLWIAEGFVQEKPGKTLEEVAQSYLNELVNRSLIQVAGITYHGKLRFRIHDFVRGYIISKSRHEILVKSNEVDMRWPDKIRRIALDASFNSIPTSWKLKGLHTLLWSGSGDSFSGAILSKLFRRGCRLLKELDLRGAPIEDIPNEVFKLYHLKYLSLRRTKVALISKSIEHLRNLETLDLKGTSVTCLPVEILKLKKLRHLLVYSYLIGTWFSNFHSSKGFGAPYEIGRLSSLQKLVYLKADEADGVKIVREIGKLTQLRRLGLIMIRKEDGMDLCSSLAKLINLRSLALISSKEEEVLELEHSLPLTFPFMHTLSLRGRLEKIPRWIASLNELTSLDLRWSRLRDNEEDPLECLQSLPNLQSLCMDYAYEGEQLNFQARGFQRLKTLNLSRLSNLRRVRVEEGSMPLLEELLLKCCKWVVDLPEGVQHLSHLQDAYFIDMSEDFSDEFIDQKRKGKDWKLKHVPRVSINPLC